jgi:hypothetical protein
MTISPPPSPRPWAERGRSLAAAAARGFHAYANWLVGISWKRFALLALLLLVASGILQQLPPFSWHIAEAPRGKPVRIDRKIGAADGKGRVEIAIDERGVHVLTHPPAASGAASGASAPSTAASGAPDDADEPVDIDLPEALAKRAQRARWGDFLTNLAAFWIVASIIVKATYKGRMQAEAQAARATETAEAEALKRQVVEARLAAMQAQVEPHFLFNTLASIDHLIETDAPRASRMQKNLIALLRASMPSMRETHAAGARDLKRELAVVRPYLEILKMRMEERLQTSIDVPEGLLSAEFPPMMIQSLVENAIQHGLEPKPEGGSLTLRAQIVHGKLAFSVADTGLGFGRSASPGTGVGLANIRERLALLYGTRAALEVQENPHGGTIVTITVPYRSLEDSAA